MRHSVFCTARNRTKKALQKKPTLTWVILTRDVLFIKFRNRELQFLQQIFRHGNKESALVGTWNQNNSQDVGASSSVLRETSVPITPSTVCRRTFRNLDIDSRIQFCAGDAGRDSCQGSKCSTVPPPISICVSVLQFAATVGHSEKDTISFQFAYQS